MLTKLKKTVQSWMTGVARIAYEVGLAPNHISAFGVILGVCSGLAYWLAGQTLANPDVQAFSLSSAAILLLASGFCDALDGALARLYEKTSALGGFLDSLLDRYVDASVFCGLILGSIDRSIDRLCDPHWGLLALLGSLLTSYARARSEAAGVPMETVGVVERSERMLILVFASLIGVVWIEALRWSVIILALATNFTVLQRVLYFWRKTGSGQKNNWAV